MPDRAAPSPPRGTRTTIAAAAAAALLLAVGVALSGDGPLPTSGGWVLALVVLALVAVTAHGWPVLLSLPSPRGSAAVIAGTGAVALVVVTTTPGGLSLARLPVVLGIAVIAACVQQLLRRDGRPRVVDALGGTLMGAGLAACAAAWTTVPSLPGGRAVALAVLVAAVALALLLAVPRPAWRAAGLVAVLGVVVAVDALRGGASGRAVGTAASGLGEGAGLWTALLAALVTLALGVGVRALLGQSVTAGRTRTVLALVAALFALLGPVAHLVAVL